MARILILFSTAVAALGSLAYWSMAAPGPVIAARLPVPVVVIGNITVGGTGKTPLVIHLALALRALGRRPGIVSRGYRGDAAQVVEVEVDEDTGMVRVLQDWVAHDCGRAINPLAVEGQIQGSVWMGMGQAVCEETRYLEGLPAHASFLEYRMPTIEDSPPIEVQIVETRDPYGPFGAKEASEGALAGFPPALVNAIANALKIDLNEIPVTPDRVMEALIQRRRQARLASSLKAAS